MLKLYDSSGAFLRMLPDTDYTDLTVVSTLQDGDKELSFTYLGKPSTIRNEYYIETDSDRYTVKEIHPGDHGTQIVCKLNLEDLEQEIYQIFTAQDVTAAAAAALALTGTGWTVSSALTKERSVQCIKKTPLEILYKIRDAFMCEIYFDTAQKVVTLADQLGQDRGVYLRTDLNLRSLSPVLDSYDYYTRLIPIGADGLEIDNDGKNYVEDYSYSSKIRTLIWEDTSYTDADALQADAQAKLADLAKPKRSYSADVIDFAKITGDNTLAFALGDTIKITDEPTGTMERQRIVKITEHPDEPSRNSVELSNTVLTWEEMQARYQAAAQAWEDISNQDGSVNGVYVHGVQGDDVVGVEVVTGSGTITTSLNSAISAVQTDYGNAITAVNARIGTVETTYLQATMANLDTANITTAKVKDLFVQVGLIKDAVIHGARITGYLDAVEINAASITAGTLVADRIAIRGSNKSIVYALNNHDQVVSTQTDSINGDVLTPRTVTADRIVAHSITANEITASNIVGTNGWINLTDGTFNYGSGHLAWDGSSLAVRGGVFAEYGKFGGNNGFTVNTNEIYSGTLGSDSSLYMSTANLGSATVGGRSGSDWRFTVGSNFGVTNTGAVYCSSLTAINADLSGKITADSGDIANWKIVKDDVNRGTTADGGHLYNSALYGHAADSTYEYEVGLKEDGGGSTLAFYIKQIPLGATWENANATDMFYIMNNGKLFAGNAEVAGKITATSGAIGGWNILGDRLEKDDVASGSYRSGMQAVTGLSGTAAFYAGCTTPAGGGIVGNSAFYVTQAGKLYANNAEIAGSITVNSGSIGDFNIVKNDTNRGTSAQGGHIYNTAMYGHAKDSSYEYEVGIKTDNATTTLAFYVKRIALGAAWTTTNATDMFYVRNDGRLYTTAMDLNGSLYMTNASFIYTTDANGNRLSALGMSVSNNLWVGPTTFASIPNRLILAETIDKIYVYNASGGTTLLSTAVSDRRLKHDIQDLTDSHDFIMGLSAKRFKINNESGDRYHFGFVAQDVRPLLERTVGDGILIAYNSTLGESGVYDPMDDSTFEYSMDYTQLIAPHIAVTQEHDRRIAELEAEVAELKRRLAS